MAGTFDLLLDSGAVATSVYNYTGDSTNSAMAGGYAAFVKSITGSIPTVYKDDKGITHLVLSVTQVNMMQKWFDQQTMSAAVAPKSNFDIGIGPVIMPLLLRYIVIIAALSFVAGYFTKSILK